MADQKAPAPAPRLFYLCSVGTRETKSLSPELLTQVAPVPCHPRSSSQPGLPSPTQLARALTAVRLVRPVSAVIITIAVVDIEDAAAVGTLKLLQVAGGHWHCRGWKEGRGGEGNTLSPGQRRGALTPQRSKMLRQRNQVSFGMALLDSHILVDQRETSLPTWGTSSLPGST